MPATCGNAPSSGQHCPRLSTAQPSARRLAVRLTGRAPAFDNPLGAFASQQNPSATAKGHAVLLRIANGKGSELRPSHAQVGTAWQACDCFIGMNDIQGADLSHGLQHATTSQTDTHFHGQSQLQAHAQRTSTKNTLRGVRKRASNDEHKHLA